MRYETVGPERQLDEGLAELDLDLSAQARAQLLRYVALLQKWNRVYNLTAIRQPSRLVSHHLLDSLAALPYLPGPTLVDVGSGAGLPGIPIAVARPDWDVVLVESNHKKGAFLRQVLVELKLPRVQVAIMRAEDWRPPQLASVAISRAFSDLSGFVEAAQHTTVPGGILAAMKGVYPDEELEQLPTDIAVDAVVPLKVPQLGAARHLVLLRARETSL